LRRKNQGSRPKYAFPSTISLLFMVSAPNADCVQRINQIRASYE
jgi:hypothetical protein